MSMHIRSLCSLRAVMDNYIIPLALHGIITTKSLLYFNAPSVRPRWAFAKRLATVLVGRLYHCAGSEAGNL